jgi:Predicted transcriptional regulators
MNFAQRLRSLREQKGYTQAELAEATGVTPRTLQYYESGKRYPNSLAIAVKLADLLGTTSEHLLGEEGGLILDAQNRGGVTAGRELRKLVEGMSALFAGGELTDEDRDAAMRALTQAYWIAKDDAKKYGGDK